ncbi:MAG: hypothetical protein AAF961_05690 [Planctomycetota bacterium]
MRLSMKDLLGVVAFCALIAWFALQTGFDSPVFWIVACIAAFQSVVFVRLAGDQKRRLLAPTPSLPFAVCCFVPFGSLTTFVNGVLILLAGVFFA